MVKYYKKKKKINWFCFSVHVPLLCSHPSLTITTLVMLVGRVEDPGFPHGELQLCFPSLLHSALWGSLRRGPGVYNRLVNGGYLLVKKSKN